MADKFPRDRFDSIPHGVERVGAHRTPPRRRSKWIALGWALLATIVLVTAGIVGVTILNERVTGAQEESVVTPTPVATAEPTIAPDVDVTVLNGTETSGLAARAGDTLAAEGIPVGALANASETNITETVVYYAMADLEGAARGVAQTLPEAEVRLDASFADTGTPLVLVLGSDYADISEE